MKKIIIWILVVIMCSSCSTERKFFHSDGPSEDMAKITVSVDPADYKIYLRQVCTSDNEAKEIYFDCPGNASQTDRKLELEYLFISNKDDRVIYITNFPDKNELIYNTPGFQFNGKIPVNPWYFGEIFIGRINKTKDSIIFIHNRRITRVISYHVLQGGNIQFSSITEKRRDVERKTYYMKSLAPPPSFKPQEDFEWMFNQYAAAGAVQTVAVPVNNNSIVIVEGKGVYFEFTRPWNNREEKGVRYKYKRLVTRIF